jgi:hypothetical protein
MQISQKYLERFAIPVSVEPKKITLNGWEEGGTQAIGVDDPDGHSLAISRWDEWDSDEPWDVQPGADRRWTFVVPMKDGVPVASSGYEFEGLIKAEDIRTWYRSKLGIVDQPTEPVET